MRSISARTGPGSPSPAVKRRLRVRRRADFQAVMAAGRLFSSPTLVGFALPRSGPPSRVGVGSSKQVGGAVPRNRVRRRLREAARLVLLVDDSPLVTGGRNFDMVLIGRVAALQAPFDQLVRDTERFVRKLMA